jgi:hypothetical protein
MLLYEGRALEFETQRALFPPMSRMCSYVHVETHSIFGYVPSCLG